MKKLINFLKIFKYSFNNFIKDKENWKIFTNNIKINQFNQTIYQKK